MAARTRGTAVTVRFFVLLNVTGLFSVGADKESPKHTWNHVDPEQDHLADRLPEPDRPPLPGRLPVEDRPPMPGRLPVADRPPVPDRLPLPDRDPLPERAVIPRKTVHDEAQEEHLPNRPAEMLWSLTRSSKALEAREADAYAEAAEAKTMEALEKLKGLHPGQLLPSTLLQDVLSQATAAESEAANAELAVSNLEFFAEQSATMKDFDANKAVELMALAEALRTEADKAAAKAATSMRTKIREVKRKAFEPVKSLAGNAVQAARAWRRAVNEAANAARRANRPESFFERRSDELNDEAGEAQDSAEYVRDRLEDSLHERIDKLQDAVEDQCDLLLQRTTTLSHRFAAANASVHQAAADFGQAGLLHFAEASVAFDSANKEYAEIEAGEGQTSPAQLIAAGAEPFSPAAMAFVSAVAALAVLGSALAVSTGISQRSIFGRHVDLEAPRLLG